MAGKSKEYNQQNHLIKVFAIIFLFWFILSGITSFFMLSLGLISAIFVSYIINRMDLIDHEISFHNFISGKLILYLFWLLKEIIVSNIKVCSYIILPNKKIKPEIINIESGQKSDFAHVIYANSITLTPGTVTINVDNDKFAVHTLDKTFKDALLSGCMQKKVMDTERDEKNTNRKENV